MASVYLTAGQVADRLGVKPQTVYDWGRKGTIKTEKHGRSVRFILDHDAEVFLKAVKEKGELI
jgi:excisionase family DNA binding protein